MIFLIHHFLYLSVVGDFSLNSFHVFHFVTHRIIFFTLNVVKLIDGIPADHYYGGLWPLLIPYSLRLSKFG